MVKEFVLIRRGEYDRLKDNPSSNENEVTQILHQDHQCILANIS